jgi:hypothetical protein
MKGPLLFRLLLRAYPARTREARGDDMTQLFLDQLRDAGSSGARARVWVDAMVDTARAAPSEHLAWRRRLKLVDGPDMPETPSFPRDARVASWPMVIAVAAILLRPPGYEPMVDIRINILGAPLGASVLLVTAIVAQVGLFASRRPAFADPSVQALMISTLLAPVPALAFLGVDGLPLLVYALLVTQAVLVLRFRRLMLALVIPFVVWLVLGPVVVGALVQLGARA